MAFPTNYATFLTRAEWKTGDVLQDYDTIFFSDRSKVVYEVGALIFSDTHNVLSCMFFKGSPGRSTGDTRSLSMDLNSVVISSRLMEQYRSALNSLTSTFGHSYLSFWS